MSIGSGPQGPTQQMLLAALARLCQTARSYQRLIDTPSAPNPLPYAHHNQASLGRARQLRASVTAYYAERAEQAQAAGNWGLAAHLEERALEWDHAAAMLLPPVPWWQTSPSVP
jgi:hypothetical protein